MDEQMQVERQKILRRDILRLVDAAKAAGGASGRLVMRILGDSASGPQDDDELTGLMVDLVNEGLVTTKDMRSRTSERRTLGNTVYAVTAKGTAVLAGVERCPLVADDRIVR